MSNKNDKNQDDDIIEIEDAEIVEDTKQDDADIPEIDETSDAPAMDDDNADAPKEVATQVIVRKGVGFGGLLIAAILGGVATIAISVGGGYYAMKTNNLGVVSALFTDVQTEVPAESKLDELAVRILSLEGEIAGLQDGIDVLSEDKALALPDDAKALPAADLAPLAEKITTLETLLATQAEQISALSVGVANGTNGSETAQAADGAQKLDIEAIKTQISALNEKISQVKQVAETAANRVSNSTSGGQATTIASAIAVASLERALQDETPFEVELDALRSFASDNDDLNALGAYAKVGLPSEITLLNQFDALLEAAMIADLKGEGATTLDKFIGNAKAIISIRRVGNVEGDTTEAVLARMEVAIKAKDLSTAVEIAAMLKDEAKATFADWVDAVNSRLTATQLMRKVNSDILKSLSQ
ncbi:MAG: hypothetical protein HRU28_00655 [Rhizobiales bacterium]|nr:hypothetical protein [Hyphomicrobiales bacterium]